MESMLSAEPNGFLLTPFGFAEQHETVGPTHAFLLIFMRALGSMQRASCFI